MKFKKLVTSPLLAAAVALAAGVVVPALGQEAKPGSRTPTLSESSYAAELLRLNQISLIKEEARTNTKPRPGRGDVGALWRAQSIRANWADVTKTRSDLRKSSVDYVTGVDAYLDSIAGNLVPTARGTAKEVADGFWAADQVNFIFSDLSTLLVTRMEYNGITDRDREELAPIAKLAVRICGVAEEGVSAILDTEGELVTGAEDEHARRYQRASDLSSLPMYYRNYGRYYMALALDPSKEKENVERRDLLNKTIKQLSDDWIEPEEAIDKLVKHQALLLRGKCQAEMGAYNLALRDLAAAQKSEKSKAEEGKTVSPTPDTVYQAKFQMVVTRARSKDFDGAHKELEAFRANPPIKPVGPEQVMMANITFDLLNFRIAWMEAESKGTDAEKMTGRLAALKPLGEMTNKVPDMYRQLIYESMLAQVSSKDEAAVLSGNSANVLPLQALAMAWNRYQQARSADADKKDGLLNEATKLADTVRNHKSATATEKLEANWVAAGVAVDRNDHEAAARLCIEYAEAAPLDDKRLKPLAKEAIDQLEVIRKAGAEKMTDSVLGLVQRAVMISGGKLKDPKWLYALGNVYAKQFETKHDPALLKASIEAYSKVPADDPNLLDAKFQSIAVNARAMDFLQKDPVAQKLAAAGILKACEDLRQTLASPPATIAKESVEKAQKRLGELNFWEIRVSLDPLQDAAKALTLIDRVEKDLGDKITPDQETSLLQSRIKAFTIKGDANLTIHLIQEIAVKNPEKATGMIKQLVAKWQGDMETAKLADNNERAKQLAVQLVELLKALIDTTTAKAAPDPAAEEAKKKQVYEYKQFQGQTMVTGEQYKEAIDLFEGLAKEHRDDAFNDFYIAHALFGQGKYREAQKKYSELIARLRVESDSWWECYYRMIKANEELMKEPGAAAQEERRKQNLSILKDLKAVYGRDKMGGTSLKDEYTALLKNYGIITE